MASDSKIMGSSVGRKFAMALSGFFLVSFLVLHVTINFISVIHEGLYNDASHFMGTNPIIQFAMQPVLAFGVIFHLLMGMRLELKNRAARPIQYASNNAGANSSWMSRNMIITGVMIMLFLGLHFYDFWIPELVHKYGHGGSEFLEDGVTLRYWEELHAKFQDPIRVGLYVLSFIFLALHLMHGFQSAFQSVGFNHNRYTPMIKSLSNAFAIVVPLGFIITAVYLFAFDTPLLN